MLPIHSTGTCVETKADSCSPLHPTLQQTPHKHRVWVSHNVQSMATQRCCQHNVMTRLLQPIVRGRSTLNKHPSAIVGQLHRLLGLASISGSQLDSKPGTDITVPYAVTKLVRPALAAPASCTPGPMHQGSSRCLPCLLQGWWCYEGKLSSSCTGSRMFCLLVSTMHPLSSISSMM